jgi:cytochrome c oxidase subunit 2
MKHSIVSRRPLAALAAAALLCAGLAGFSLAQQGERVVRITAERYSYEPEKIVLKKGQPVILELVAEDRMHGFNSLALGIRADVLPDQAVRVRLVPDKVGTFPFICDVFCGSGHGEMGGVITVVE